ncbi:hypothetical protein KGF54_000109 [Candida jiufengensis]|uniref:uncharacterized protein n=1 Tax=Candida jiufengensis TaxID=497108 RepID=UPI0022250DD3|nr:uncharacterized protein KGF54_000109 [Candida jiufengensis]KAI5957181.1 hypothetical protein KGF54_000109 [Candida jiufengensis]
MKLITTLLFNFAFSFAFVPNVNIQQHQKEVNQFSSSLDIIEDISLNNLLHINDKSDISSYQLSNGIKFDSGRLILSKLDSLWSNQNIPQRDFTIELIFRSTGKTKDIQFDDNNLSLWIYNDVVSTIGSKNFDGFKISINNFQQQGLKLFNNDGSSSGDKYTLEESIGDCGFRYLESDVPFTIRISYSSERNWFKIQVDNNLCFKTDKIKIPEDNNYRFGLTSFVNEQSLESFEILSIKIWDKLTEDSIDDHGVIIDGELKIDTINKVIDDDDHVKPSVVRESLMERARKHREEMLQIEKQTQQQQPNSGQDFSIILDRLNDLEFSIADLSKIVGSSSTSSSSSNSGEFSKQDFQDLKNSLDQTQLQISNLQSTISKQYIELLQSISELNKKVIGEVREQHYGMEELSKKVDLLMNEHKEVAYQYQKQKNQEPQINIGANGNDSVVDKLIKWILIPLVIVLLVLVVFVYRLRHDIKHSKLL